MNDRRLIEVAFPLKQASLDSVHEKNVRHGHISTLHVWPARRPLAACRAALIATLLQDPGTPEKRQELCERIGGRVIKKIERKKGPGAKGESKIVEETVGGVLHWKRETENKADMAFFREEIRKAFGGRAPRVMDPFAGGGAIPLEAMRLGCEVTAIDINPVAWFILKCTLEYPQKLAGQRRPLPEFVRRDVAFMEEFFKAQGFKGAGIRSQLRKLGLEGSKKAASAQRSLTDTTTGKDIDTVIEEHTLDADLAWHVRAWGSWVLGEARRELARYYPVYADFQPLKDVDDWRTRHPDQARQMTLVPTRHDGTADVGPLNAEFTDDYLGDDRKPRWVAKPTVAYLWARTVKCKNCRATIPLLKTCWLAKRDAKRVLLHMKQREDKAGVAFTIESSVPVTGGNNAQRRESDRLLGQGTMSRAGAWCPCCGKAGTVAMETADIRAEGAAGRISSIMTAVVVDGRLGKEFRLPTDLELSASAMSVDDVCRLSPALPFGLPNEPVPIGGGTGAGRAFSVHAYGISTWAELFSPRQLLALSTLAAAIRKIEVTSDARWHEGIRALVAAMLDRQANQSSTLARWNQGGGNIEGTFARFALPIVWDYAEVNPLATTSGGFRSAIDWIGLATEHLTEATLGAPTPRVRRRSAILTEPDELVDVIVTDPPYYDAIPYSDLMDFFYVWLRRIIGDAPGAEEHFQQPLSPKWSRAEGDGELIDDSRRHDGNAVASKQSYEGGMARAFLACASRLGRDGRLVIVFANKQPDAWETLVSAIIRAGFVVDGSWPIETERAARVRSLSSAALASSVWLVCKKREVAARAGWDNIVLEEMRKSIGDHLREFWVAGIRGPDFVWAATGPALEAYSKHPIVKKANEPGQTMDVSEFLRAVRRMVVEFVVGRVLGELTHGAIADTEAGGVSGLDDITTYYLLHRHDFGMNDAPAGACILYALSCNLSESDLAGRYGVLLRSGGDEDDDGEPVEGDADAEGDVSEGSGSTFKLRPWKQRRRAGFGQPSESGSGTVPIVDMAHYLMHLWIEGDVHKVNAYIDDRALRRNETFKHVLQALIELSAEGGDERSVLERISNHLHGRGLALDRLHGFDEPADGGVTQ